MKGRKGERKDKNTEILSKKPTKLPSCGTSQGLHATNVLLYTMNFKKEM